MHSEQKTWKHLVSTVSFFLVLQHGQFSFTYVIHNRPWGVGASLRMQLVGNSTLYVLISSSRTSSEEDAQSRDLYFSSFLFKLATSS